MPLVTQGREARRVNTVLDEVTRFATTARKVFALVMLLCMKINALDNIHNKGLIKNGYW